VKVIESVLDEDVFAYLEVLSAHYPHPIPFARIKIEKPGVLDGVNQTRLKEKLPRQLAKLIHRGQKGHALKFSE
jgi:hypothetical protein